MCVSTDSLVLGVEVVVLMTSLSIFPMMSSPSSENSPPNIAPFSSPMVGVALSVALSPPTSSAGQSEQVTHLNLHLKCNVYKPNCAGEASNVMKELFSSSSEEQET